MKRKLSVRRACELLGISRRWLTYRGVAEDRRIVALLLELAKAHPRWGYRMLHRVLNRERAKAGVTEKVNVKKVRRLCQVHGLTLQRKRRKKRRGIGTSVPCRAEYPGHVWAYDFVFDLTAGGRQLKILTVIDEFTRQALAVEVEHRMGARFVIQTLQRLFSLHGVPQYIRSDNGPEFIAQALMRFLAQEGVGCRHIEPGSPWQNGRNERFNGTLRSECLDLETFAHRDQARAICKLYQRHYNQERPHSALGYQTPDEFAARQGPAAPAPASAAPRPALPPQAPAGVP